MVKLEDLSQGNVCRDHILSQYPDCVLCLPMKLLQHLWVIIRPCLLLQQTGLVRGFNLRVDTFLINFQHIIFIYLFFLTLIKHSLLMLP